MRTLVLISWHILWTSVHESSGLPDAGTGVALCPLPKFREALDNVLRVSNVTSDQLSIVGGREGVEANYLQKYSGPCAGGASTNRAMGSKPVRIQATLARPPFSLPPSLTHPPTTFFWCESHLSRVAAAPREASRSTQTARTSLCPSQTSGLSQSANAR